MRDKAGIARFAGFAVVGALAVAGGARAESGAPAPAAADHPVVEIRVPDVPAKSTKPVALEAGDLQGYAVRVGGFPVLTPAVDGTRVYAGDVVEMRAFDALDGSRLWSSRVDDSQPTAPAVSSGHVYFNTQSCTLYDVEARTGERGWSKLVAHAVNSTPAVLGDRVYVTGPADGGGFKLEAYAARSGGLVFRVPLPADAITAPVASGDRLFLALGDGTVVAMDRDGKELWKRDVKALAAPWPTEDRLLVACGDPANPDLVRLDRRTGTPDDRAVATPRDDGKGLAPGGDPAPKAGGAGRPVAPPVPPASPGAGLGGPNKGRRGVPAPPPPPIPLGSGSAYASFGYEGPRPCVLGDVVAMTAGGDLVLRGVAAGEPRRVALGAPPVGAPVAAGTMFVQATRDGRILGIDPATGARRFEVRLTRAGNPLVPAASPSVWRGRAYLGTSDGLLLAFDLPDPSADGWPMWGGSPSRSK